MQEVILPLAEAAKVLKRPESSLRREINAGKMPGVRMKKGTRDTWGISQSTINALQNKGLDLDYDTLYNEWQTWQTNGLLTGKPLSQATVDNNHYGMQNYWKYCGLDKAIDNIRPEIFRMVVAGIKIDHDKQSCQYAHKCQMYDALRLFYRFLIEKKLKSKDELQLLLDYRPERIYKPKRRSIKQEQFERMLDKNETRNRGKGQDGFHKAFNKTLFFLMGYGALRRGEIIRLKLEDINFKERYLVAHGKGYKSRKVPMVVELYDQLVDWITYDRPQSKEPYLMLQRNGKQITKYVIRGKVQRLADSIGADCSAHVIRAYCATQYLDAGVPVTHVRDFMGHTRIETTMIYNRMDEEVMMDSFRNFKGVDALMGTSERQESKKEMDLI